MSSTGAAPFSLLRMIAQPAAIIDSAFQIVDANDAFAQMLTYDAHVQAGCAHLSQIGCLWLPPLPEALERLFGSGAAFENLRLGGGRANDNAAMRIGGCLLEHTPYALITVQPGEQYMMRQVEHIFHEMIQHTKTVFTLADTGQPPSYISSAYEAVWGRTAESFYAQPDLAETVFPADRPIFLEALEGAARGEFNTVRYRIQRPDGAIRWIVSKYFPVKGSPMRMAGLYWDVTESVHQEQAMREREAHYRAIVESLHEGIWLIDSQAKTTFVNPQMAQMLGYTPEEMLGHSCLDYVSPGFNDRVEQSIAACQRVQPDQGDIQLMRRDGTSIWVLFKVTPSLDAAGEYRGALVTVIDITDRKRAEAHEIELRLERERMRALEGLITDISHDLRTPATVIRSSTYLIQRLIKRLSMQAEALLGRENVSDELRSRYHEIRQVLILLETRLDMLDNHAERLHRFIENFLEMIRLDTGVEFDLTQTDLNALITAVVNNFAVVADKHMVELALETQADLPLIMLDISQFPRALNNLIENAIYYTPAGGNVKIRTFAQGEHLVIEVKDSGRGILATDLTRIFERFFRAEEARSIRAGGTGLGLSISKKVVEAHGGHITVQSAPGKGSTFRVFLPQPPTA